MEKILSQFNIDAMVFGAIVASVILAFVLVVVIFSVRYKGQYEKIADLGERLKEREEKILLLEESLREVQILNATQLQEIGQYQDLEARYKAEKAKVEEQLALAKERIDTQREKIADLEAKRAELEAHLHNTRDNLAKANEEIENVRKRNEFWVEQLSELRTKYEAIKSKLRKYEG